MVNRPFGGGGLFRKVHGELCQAWATEIGCASGCSPEIYRVASDGDLRDSGDRRAYALEPRTISKPVTDGCLTPPSAAAWPSPGLDVRLLPRDRALWLPPRLSWED